MCDLTVVADSVGSFELGRTVHWVATGNHASWGLHRTLHLHMITILV